MDDYLVVFNSRQNAEGTNRNDLTYNFDWTRIPDVDYTLSFTWTGEANVMNGTKNALIYVDLGASTLCFSTSDTNYANRSLFIGCLRTNSHGSGTGNSFTLLVANDTDNGHIHVKGRPHNQTIRVRVLDGSLNPFTDTDNAELAHYIFGLRLERVYVKVDAPQTSFIREEPIITKKVIRHR